MKAYTDAYLPECLNSGVLAIAFTAIIHVVISSYELQLQAK